MIQSLSPDWIIRTFPQRSPRLGGEYVAVFMKSCTKEDIAETGLWINGGRRAEPGDSSMTPQNFSGRQIWNPKKFQAGSMRGGENLSPEGTGTERPGMTTHRGGGVGWMTKDTWTSRTEGTAMGTVDQVRHMT